MKIVKKMNILIVEDEIPAQKLLIRLISKYYPDFNIVAILDSITSAIGWIRSNNPDIIFMDVELSDGSCFEIFKHVDIKSPVIITTAYEQYALEAFKSKCIDYLLKPVEDSVFKESVERCLNFYNKRSSQDYNEKVNNPKCYRQRYTLQIGNQIEILNVSEIAYFYSEDKSNFIVAKDGNSYMTDLSLDTIKEELDPVEFFKISRGCIVSPGSISSISKYFNSRLKITLKPSKCDPVLISRERVKGFLEWLEGKK